MKNTYFVYQDPEAAGRQSDGVEFCVITEFHDYKIYFYCSEYMLFWSAIKDVGDLSKAKDLNPKLNIRPANLVEICDSKLCDYISTIKQYDIENNKLLDIKYIHLN